MSCLESVPREDAVTSGNPEDVVVLHGFPRAGGTASSVSPFVAKVETFLRFANIPYEVEVVSMGKAPKGKAPYVVHGPNQIEDSALIIKYLINTYPKETSSLVMDSGFDSSVALTCQKTMEDDVFWGILYYRYFNSEGWAAVKSMYFGHKSPIKRPFIAWMAKRKAARALRSQGQGFRSENDMQALMSESLQAVATLLGDKNYLGGDTPCAADAAVFGVLDNLLHDGFKNSLAAYVYKLPNLLEYCYRIRAEYYRTTSPIPRLKSFKAVEDKMLRRRQAKMEAVTSCYSHPKVNQVGTSASDLIESLVPAVYHSA